MLSAIIEQRKTINSIIAERTEMQQQINRTKRAKLSAAIRPAPDDLQTLDFGTINSICNLLKPFEILTRKLSEEQSTASILIPAFKNLERHLRNKSANYSCSISSYFAETLHSQISERFTRIQNEPILCFSMLIDRRFSYDEMIKSNLEWKIIEDDFIYFCREGLFIINIIDLIHF